MTLKGLLGYSRFLEKSRSPIIYRILLQATRDYTEWNVYRYISIKNSSYSLLFKGKKYKMKRCKPTIKSRNLCKGPGHSFLTLGEYIDFLRYYYDRYSNWEEGLGFERHSYEVYPFTARGGNRRYVDRVSSRHSMMIYSMQGIYSCPFAIGVEGGG